MMKFILSFNIILQQNLHVIIDIHNIYLKCNFDILVQFMHFDTYYDIFVAYWCPASVYPSPIVCFEKALI